MEEGEFLEEFVDPEDILCGISECNIFRFSAREGDNGLFLGAPRDSAKTDEVSEAGDGMTVILGCPVSIQKSGDGRVASQNKFELLRSK